MDKFFIKMAAALITCLLAMLFLTNNVIKEHEADEARMKAKIGTTVIIHKDTLIVLDYKLFNKTYVLSNGVEVAENFIK